MIRALLWDVDGTLAETERDGHRVAFNRAFADCGLPWRWGVERYGELLRITGGRERLLHDMATRADAPSLAAGREALATELHRRKNALYAELVAAGGIALRPGVAELLAECRGQGVRLAIVTTTSRANVEALLQRQPGGVSTGWFEAMVCGEDVQRKKPDPQVLMLALQQLGLAPREALAIEDSPAGVMAARGAGVPVVVTRSVYFEHDGVEGAIAVGPGLDRRSGWAPPARAAEEGAAFIGLADLLHWRSRMETASSRP